MTHSDAASLFVAQFERLELVAYPDGNQIWTLGYGHTWGVKEGDTCTKEQALQWLSEDLGVADGAVSRLVTVSLTQNEFDALVSLVFNIGQGRFAKSTCLRLLNQNFKAAAINSIATYENDEWHGWVYVAGQVSKGLVTRRQAEQKLFETVEAA